MRNLWRTAQFRRDYRRAFRRGKDIALLDQVIERLLAGEELESRYRVHRLVGNWHPCWECRIAHDWLLVWEDDGDTITLRNTGTHSDIFGW